VGRGCRHSPVGRSRRRPSGPFTAAPAGPTTACRPSGTSGPAAWRRRPGLSGQFHPSAHRPHLGGIGVDDQPPVRPTEIQGSLPLDVLPGRHRLAQFTFGGKLAVEPRATGVRPHSARWRGAVRKRWLVQRGWTSQTRTTLPLCNSWPREVLTKSHRTLPRSDTTMTASWSPGYPSSRRSVLSVPRKAPSAADRSTGIHYWPALRG
jgi:hypothetical protein